MLCLAIKLKRCTEEADLCARRRRDPFTGRIISTRLVEMKSGNSPLSPLQKKLKKNKSIKVERVSSGFWQMLLTKPSFSQHANTLLV
jgi:hypothetical protein